MKYIRILKDISKKISYIRSWYSCKIQKETAVKMMNSYMKRGYPYFLNTNVSKLLRGVGGDVSGLYGVISQIFKIITEGLTAFLHLYFYYGNRL